MIKKTFLFLLFLSAKLYAQNVKFDSLNDFSKIRNFAENFRPNYIVNGDTLVVGRILVPNELNGLFKYYNKRKVKESYKYAFLVVMKLRSEYIVVNNFDYDFCDYRNNSLIDLILTLIRSGKDPIGCVHTRTLEIFIWLKKHPSIYRNYTPLKDELKKLEKLKIHTR